jgi:hypothetical protein
MMNMKTVFSYIIIISLLFVTGACYRAKNPVPVCRVEKNNIIFRLDNRWTRHKIQETALLFDLDTSIFIKAFGNEKKFVVNNTTWKVKIINSHFVELSRPIVNLSDSLFANGFAYMLNEDLFGKKTSMSKPPEKYGINIFLRDNTFKYKNGEAFFWLPGHKEARSVCMSGSFNNWNTSGEAMVPCDSGWTISIRLQPGRYAYKYIIDGNWTPDPANTLKEDDLVGSFNSVFYCVNHLFKIDGRRDASEIRVTGTFMNWDPAGLKLRRTPAGWELPVYLREGTYAYKFISGTEWFTDPKNPDVRDDGNGNMNSYLTIGNLHTFKLVGYAGASSVILSGTFNNWNQSELKMKKTDDVWTISCSFPPGNYEYKFIVDGKWITDPSNENTTGSGENINSVISLNPNHTFVLEDNQDAKEVMVTGSFNGWGNPGYRMSKRDGKWVIQLYLSPGKTRYKFIINGVWKLDPGNDQWEDNEYGTGNSVLWI